MTSPQNASSPVKPPPSFAPGQPLAVNVSDVIRPNHESRIVSEPITNGRLPLRHRNSSLGPSPSLSSSPNRTTSHPTSSLGITNTLLDRDLNDDIRSIIIRAFSPVIAIYAAPETDELARRKGFRHGLRQLVQPFGEKLDNKVVIHDSAGSSRAWNDFGVRFVNLDYALASASPSLTTTTATATSSPKNTTSSQALLAQLEKLTEAYAAEAEETLQQDARNEDSPTSPVSPFSSPGYGMLMRRLLTANAIIPHETFAHPVACVIAISPSTPQPLESLRRLYAQTNGGEKSLPSYVFPEYLRYYLLVHDEDRDDLKQSIALYDQMRRSFGLNCHMLRLRSIQCVKTDDDSVPFPQSEFLTPQEDLDKRAEDETVAELDPESQYIFESDEFAIKSFVRELVLQTVSSMERRTAMWNDQVASKRKGLSGKFLSMSRRWAFGSHSRSSGYGPGSGDSYNHQQGFYSHDAQEATLRKLADYAFMLRDWKLASTTYEIVQGDFAHDKAWIYHAAANEMCAISTLLNPLISTSTSKLEPIEQTLNTACYSYLTRCSDPRSTLRTMLLGMELLKLRGDSAAELAAKLAVKTLDMGLLGAYGRVLISERVAACYASKVPWSGSARIGTRRRKTAMWMTFAADAWLQRDCPNLASSCLMKAKPWYEKSLPQKLEPGVGYWLLPFAELDEFLRGLDQALSTRLDRTGETEEATAEGVPGDSSSIKNDNIEEASTVVDDTPHTESTKAGSEPAADTASSTSGPATSAGPRSNEKS